MNRLALVALCLWALTIIGCYMLVTPHPLLTAPHPHDTPTPTPAPYPHPRRGPPLAAPRVVVRSRVRRTHRPSAAHVRSTLSHLWTVRTTSDDSGPHHPALEGRTRHGRQHATRAQIVQLIARRS